MKMDLLTVEDLSCPVCCEIFKSPVGMCRTKLLKQ